MDDIEASARKARELGATVLHDVTAVGDYGRFSVIVNPGGAAIAMWQPKMDK